jgi:hypothetical protein
MSDKHVNASGDVILIVRLSIIKKEEPCHSLSSDLGSLINDEASSDLILQAGERKFRVHRNILAARSPVFASLLAQLEEELKAKEAGSAEARDGSVTGDHNIIEEESEEAVTCEEVENEKTETGRTPLESSIDGVEIEKDILEVKVDERKRESIGEETEKPIKKLVINDLSSDTVEELLRYIYTDSSNNVDLFSQTLLAASDIYQVGSAALCLVLFSDFLSSHSSEAQNYRKGGIRQSKQKWLVETGDICGPTNNVIF